MRGVSSVSVPLKPVHNNSYQRIAIGDVVMVVVVVLVVVVVVVLVVVVVVVVVHSSCCCCCCCCILQIKRPAGPLTFSVCTRKREGGGWGIT